MATCPACRAHFADDVERCPTDGEGLLPDAAFLGADTDLKPGDAAGEYRIERKLGEGGFGTVYEAVHPVIGKRAAVKVLARQWSGNPQMVSRFVAEARAVNQIRHRNIIDVFGFGALPDGRHFYVMELLTGQPFDAFVRARGRVPPETALPLLRAVARALDAAHARGIVHRDLKTENVFLVRDDDGRVEPRLLDFGIAKLLGETTSGHQTRSGTPLGTPRAMSPEQCRGRAVDHRTDVYALGVMAHEVLTGKHVFEGESIMDVLVQHMSARPPRMSEACPALPAALDEPVLRMLEKEPEARPASAGAAIDALFAAAADAGIAVEPAGARGTPAGVLAADEAVPASRARTVVAPEGAGRTFIPAEADVAARPRRRTLLMATLAVVGVAAGAAAVVLLAPRGAAQGPVAPPATGAPSANVAPRGAGPAASQPAAPAEVAVTVESNAPGSSVWVGASRLGDAPGPVKLPRGAAKVTLTVRAEGWAPASVDVVPTQDVVAAVRLARLAPQPPGTATGAPPATGRRVSKDLENPF